MKKTLLLLAALSAVTFGASTGVHTNTGSNAIDVETKAFIVNSGLVITRTAGDANDTIKDAIKKATLDHGTLMAGTSAQSQATRTVYIRKTNGQNFPEGTVLNIALNADSTNNNNLVNSGNTIPHTLDAVITKATNNNGNYTGAAVTNDTLTITGEDKKENAADFEVEKDAHYVEVGLTSTIAGDATTSATVEGSYTNTSTLAVRFSKIPTTANDETYVNPADYPTPGQPIEASR